MSDDAALAELRKQVGAYAYKQLRLGRATVHRWRGVNPSNWWVEGIRGAMLWHNDNTQWGDCPPMRLFEKVNDYQVWGTVYRLKPPYLQEKSRGQRQQAR
jgi:hypothetical protein